MQRGVILIVAAVIGVIAIVLAVRELTDNPETVPPRSEVPERGGPRTVGVRMRDISFVPDNVSIRAGQTVLWTNDDQTEHTVTRRSQPGRFDSGRIPPGESYRRTFVDSGVFEYFCTIHPNAMRARVTVLGD